MTLTVYVHFGVLKFKEKARLAPFGGCLTRHGELVSSSAYRMSVHSVLSAEQKLLHSVQVQTKCSEISVHSVLSAHQNLCMSGKCRVQCALCVAWNSATAAAGGIFSLPFAFAEHSDGFSISDSVAFALPFPLGISDAVLLALQRVGR